MQYHSTRGRAASVGFESALIEGLARDGGLYVPVAWPSIGAAEISAFKGRPYAEIAAKVLSLFAGDAFDQDALLEHARGVYGSFSDKAVAPLVRVDEEDWVLELFHGPTLAFKDFAMQILGRLFDDVLKKRQERLTIIAATSGDTGAAAIHALAPCQNVNVVVLHPHGGVTDVQRRMMTTVDQDNVLNVAVAGDFDQCQSIVKDLFADDQFRRKVCLSGVNSINWARLSAQTVYYFSSIAVLGEGEGPIHFVVPTGNFGDVYAGYAAKKMGAPVGTLGVAVNANDILHRAIKTGAYVPENVERTLSPSMDIQVASNFERLLFDLHDGDGKAVRREMEKFRTDRALQLDDALRSKIDGDFVSAAASEEDTLAQMKSAYKQHGRLIDPHTAVALHAAQRFRGSGKLKGRIVTLSTAHAAKFPEAVALATGKTPSLPPRWSNLFDLQEHMEYSPAETEAVKALIIKRFE
ncbi:MAG: threonine synthase [Pseudomonadota bacterium]